MTWHSVIRNLLTTCDVHLGPVSWEVPVHGDGNGVDQDQEMTMLEARLVVLAVPAVNHQQYQMELNIRNRGRNWVPSVGDLVRETFLSTD
jgi:hypothetical protein